MSIRGAGEVYEGVQKRAKVRYDLSIEREHSRTGTFDGSQVVETGQSGTGSIYDVQERKINLYVDMHKILTLPMGNGQKQDFKIEDCDNETGRFIIIELSGEAY